MKYRDEGRFFATKPHAFERHHPLQRRTQPIMCPDSVLAVEAGPNREEDSRKTTSKTVGM